MDYLLNMYMTMLLLLCAIFFHYRFQVGPALRQIKHRVNVNFLKGFNFFKFIKKRDMDLMCITPIDYAKQVC